MFLIKSTCLNKNKVKKKCSNLGKYLFIENWKIKTIVLNNLNYIFKIAYQIFYSQNKVQVGVQWIFIISIIGKIDEFNFGFLKTVFTNLVMTLWVIYK